MSNANTYQAMLVQLCQSYWQAIVTDQDVSTKVATLYSNDKAMGRYHKRLFQKGTAPLYAKLLSAFAHAESLHKLETLRFLPSVGILPVTNYVRYNDLMSDASLRISVAKRLYLEAYPTYVEEAKVYLNGAYNPADYPSVSEMEQKFSLTTRILPLPDGAHFDVQGPGIDVEAIREEINKETAEAIQNTVQELYMRLRETLNELGSKLSGDKDIRNRSIERAKGMISRLDVLNLTDNAILKALSRQSYAMIEGWDLDNINKEPVVRATSLAEIDRIRQAMANIV